MNVIVVAASVVFTMDFCVMFKVCAYFRAES